MDPLFDRLGRLIRSFGVDTSSRPTDGMTDDERAAFEDLEAELSRPRGAPAEPERTRAQSSQARPEQPRPSPGRPTLDPALVEAYAVLGVPPSASWEDVQAAHRALLKKHHPDRHAGHAENQRKATAMSQKIGEAYQRVKKSLGR